MNKKEKSRLLKILKQNKWKKVELSQETINELYERLEGDYKRYKNGINY